MVEKAKKVSVLAGSVVPESVKVVAESVGLADLPDAVLTYVADEVTFRLRHTVQVCLLIITLLAAPPLDTRPCISRFALGPGFVCHKVTTSAMLTQRSCCLLQQLSARGPSLGSELAGTLLCGL